MIDKKFVMRKKKNIFFLDEIKKEEITEVVGAHEDENFVQKEFHKWLRKKVKSFIRLKM